MVFVERTDIAAGIAKLQILDVTGKLISTSTIHEQKQTVDLSTLTSGVYILKVTDKQNSYSMKLAKQ